MKCFFSKLSKLWKLILFFFSGFYSVAVFAQDPVVLFSDLVSAPGTGWSMASPNKGAVVTIWGRNFGSSRNNSYVSVNGVDLVDNSDYLDVWGKRNNPVPFLETITFQLNDSMNLGSGTIVVTVDGVLSNSIPFRVNSSEIKFVDVNVSGPGTGTLTDPLSNPTAFIDNMSPGDVIYFRGGLYDQEFDGGKSVIWIRENRQNGTAQDPIGLVAFPGEDAHLDSLANGNISNFNGGIQVSNGYITVSKFRVTAHLRGIWGSHYSRIIGNEVTGVVDHLAGDGAIHNGGQGPIILGNSVHGARSGNRLDHAIYIDGCQDQAGGEIAYNHAFDNDVERGPHLVDNHQNTRCAPNQFMKSNYWHNNLIECDAGPSRAIGIYDLSWDVGEAQEPDPAYVYNNIILGCGDGWHGAIYHNNGHAFIYNNTLVDNRGKGIQIFDSLVLSTTVANNAFVQGLGITDACVDVDQNSVNISSVEIDSNSYFGGCSVHPIDLNGIVTDPMITATPLQYNSAGIGFNSPLINAGSNSVANVLDKDFHAVDRDSSFDIGAIEYFAAGSDVIFTDGFE